MHSPHLDTILSLLVEQYTCAVADDKQAMAFPDLLTVVEQCLMFCRKLGLRMIETFVNVRLAQVKADKPRCPDCGEPMELLANSHWKHGTPLGLVDVADVYAYCRPCNRSCRPLHALLGTDREPWSLAVEKDAVDLCSDESCERASHKLEQHHPGVQIGRTSMLRMLHNNGTLARDFVTRKLQEALEQAAEEGNDGSQGHALLELEVEHDGGMIPVALLEPLPSAPGAEPERTPVRDLLKRRKNMFWQEVKVGLVQVPGEVQGRLYSVRPHGELDEAFDDLFALARIKGCTDSTQVRGLSDGAQHIRTRLQETFHSCDFLFILDRPHAREHLTEAGEALAAHGGLGAQPWADAAMDKLESGNVLSVVFELRKAYEATGAEPLRLNANYFERNQDAVAYADYRAKGWSTASSEVESAHRHIVQVRIKIPGAWWHPDNVPGVLALRMLKANGWWEDFWKERRNAWHQRAQTFAREQGYRRRAA